MDRTRHEVILEKLTGIIQEMSGLTPDEIDPSESFLALGFDSLFLTQANLKFKKEFKVKITFRQLFDEAPCLRDLATYIDDQLPEEALQDELRELPPAATPAAATSGGLPGLGAVPPGSLQSLPAIDPSLLAGNGGALIQALTLQSQASAVEVR